MFASVAAGVDLIDVVDMMVELCSRLDCRYAFERWMGGANAIVYGRDAPKQRQRNQVTAIGIMVAGAPLPPTEAELVVFILRSLAIRNCMFSLW